MIIIFGVICTFFLKHIRGLIVTRVIAMALLFKKIGSVYLRHSGSVELLEISHARPSPVADAEARIDGNGLVP
jgi:hypothetical protein